MFAQGRRPAVVIPAKDAARARAALVRAGYESHTGARYRRAGEIQAFTSELPNGRHVHVQEVRWKGGRIAYFAHTEPATGLAHIWSALTDGANYSDGARKLRAAFRAAGFRHVKGSARGA
jgi:hypothetical protein